MQQSSSSILVVDDDLAIREVITALLEDEGYAVVAASNGLAAMDVLYSTNKLPCLILLDLNMPIMTGWEFRRVQQHDPVLSSIPVAVISADRTMIQQPSALDAIAYFAKPIDFDQLVGLVADYCCGTSR